LLLERDDARSRRAGKAIVVGNGRCPDRNRLPSGALDDARLVVAADGGLRTALALGLRPDFVIGDGDSLRDGDRVELEQRGISFEPVPAEKDASDLELAVRHVLAAGVAEIVVLGALGGLRVDHSLANILLLAMPDLAGVELSLVDDVSTIRAARAGRNGGQPQALRIAGRRGDFVSLFAVGGESASVTTDGLKYPLGDEPLALGTSRGVSNELVGNHATVTVTRGVALVVHTSRRIEQEETDDAPR
jgi:thiamine pyrophosphokinase